MVLHSWSMMVECVALSQAKAHLKNNPSFEKLILQQNLLNLPRIGAFVDWMACLAGGVGMGRGGKEGFECGCERVAEGDRLSIGDCE